MHAWRGLKTGRAYAVAKAVHTSASERCSVLRRGSVLREVLYSQGGGKIIPYVVEMVKVFNFELLKWKGLLSVSHVLQ